VIEYSPSGLYLAVGSHDNCIYIYKTNNDYSLVNKISSHKAAITAIDWSFDESYIRSVCNGYELLFHRIPDCAQDPDGASNTKGVYWASHHVKFGWLVDGIFPKDCDGTHINGVDHTQEYEELIACGDDYGLVQLFRCPSRKGA
jgi:WD40 repeat protein